MARLFILVCLMTMVSSLGMGAENDLGNHPDLPRALDHFRHVVSTIKRLEDIPDRNPQEEQQFREACRGFYKAKNAVLFCRSGEIDYEQERVFFERRARALLQIQFGEFGLACSYYE